MSLKLLKFNFKEMKGLKCTLFICLSMFENKINKLIFPFGYLTFNNNKKSTLLPVF